MIVTASENRSKICLMLAGDSLKVIWNFQELTNLNDTGFIKITGNIESLNHWQFKSNH